MTQSHRDTFIHLFAGGVAGTVGAIVTCPLEVVKTRLQSSSSGFHVCLPKIATPEGTGRHVTCKTIPSSNHRRRFISVSPRHVLTISTYGVPPSQQKGFGLIQCLRFIVENEGPKALFKGLGPNLVGVAPSRAIYFCAYSQAKSFFNCVFTPDTPVVHIMSASSAVEIGKSLHYWKGRLLKTKTDQEAINKRLQEEYDKTYKKYEYEPKRINKNDVAQMKKLKAALIKCYKANQKKSLNCSKEVENFNTWFEESKIRNRVEEKKRKEEKEKKMMEEEEKKKAKEAADADYIC